MRHIGNVPDQESAKRLGGFLLTCGIQSTADEEPDGWAIWIFDEDHVERARDELQKFLASPNEPQYLEAAAAAAHIQKAAEQRERQARSNVVDVRKRWERPTIQNCPVTLALIALSVLTVIVTTDWEGFDMWRLGNRHYPVLEYLRFTLIFDEAGQIVIDRFNPDLFREIKAGQVWRLVTPIFVHYSVLHILFNMLMMRDLGTAVEFRRGGLRMLGIVLVIAVVSNVFQAVMSGPAFGGMSGVVYGLIGYIWMKSRFDPQVGLFMPRQLLIWAGAWFFICLFGVVGNIANWAHGMGLVSGMVIGYLPVLWRKLT